MYRVEWAQNPLASKIYLDDAGRERLKLGIAIDEISSAQALFSLIKGDNDIKWADRFDPPDDNIEEWINEKAKRLESYLLEEHCGDCTCAPASCMKCYAEDLAGINTDSGTGSHERHNVEMVFRKVTTLDEAIFSLENDPIECSWGTPEQWAPYAERWEKECKSAAEWLKKYRQEHFPGV